MCWEKCIEFIYLWGILNPLPCCHLLVRQFMLFIILRIYFSYLLIFYFIFAPLRNFQFGNCWNEKETLFYASLLYCCEYEEWIGSIKNSFTVFFRSFIFILSSCGDFCSVSFTDCVWKKQEKWGRFSGNLICGWLRGKAVGHGLL